MSSYNCCDSLSKEFTQVSNLTSILKVVTEENRLKILCILKNNEHCVCEIMDHLKLSQSLISHHLRDLWDAKLVYKSKKGAKIYYFLTEKGKYISNLLFQIPVKEEKL